MSKILAIKIGNSEKITYIEAKNIHFDKDQIIIIRTKKGTQYAIIMSVLEENNNKKIDSTVQFIRKANSNDLKLISSKSAAEKNAFDICKERIDKCDMEMDLISAEYSFDRKKLVFYFRAEHRIDFRNLVKYLASTLKTRIEMRQAGVRDEAKMIGGYGICGRELCCSSFLDEFVPVSMNMAEDQNVSLNPTKISGLCGRLLCCLKYEQDTYEELISKTPKSGSEVVTPKGKAVVIDSDLFTGVVKVSLIEKDQENKKTGAKDILRSKDTEDNNIFTFDRSELKIIDQKNPSSK